MYITVNNHTFNDIRRWVSPSEIVYTGDSIKGIDTVSGVISVYSNSGFGLANDAVDSYARQIVRDGAITLTNLPEDYVPPKTVEQRIGELEQINTISFTAIAENGEISEETASNYPDVFKAWESGVSYTVGNLRNYEHILYKCVTAHTSQDDWTPDVASSLWSKAGSPIDEFPEWIQPTGAHDAYDKGAKVSHLNKHWVSDIDANTYEPSVYGWTEVNS